MALGQVTSTWNSTTGNWSDFTRWSTNPLFPNNGNGGVDYNAIIGGGTVTLDQDIEVDGLTMGNGTLSGDFDVLIYALFDWGYSTMEGTGTTTIAPGGTLTLNAVTNNGFDRTLTRPLINNGSATFSGTTGLNLGSGVVFQNNGSFTTVGNHRSINGGVFNNAGSFIKTTGFGTTVGSTFNNSGTVDVQGGGLALDGGGNHTGDFTGAAGAGLTFSGDHTFAVGSDITGGMSVTIGSGTINGLVNITGTLSTGGGTQIFNAPVTAGALHIGGNSTFNSTINAPGGSLYGALAGPANWTITGTLDWGYSTMGGTGTTTIAPGGTLTLNAVTNNGFDRTLTRPLINNGSATFSGTTGLNLGSGVVFQNNGSFTTVGNHRSINGGVFNNAGSFIKTTGFGTTVGSTFNNSGTVDVQGGGLALDGGGNHTGDFTGVTGATLQFSGTHNFAATTYITGGMNVDFGSSGTHDGAITTTGSLSISGGTNAFNGTVSVGTLNLQGGTNSFNGSVSTGVLNMSGGTNTFNGSLTAPGGTFSGGMLSGSANWNVTGTLNWIWTSSNSTMAGTGQTMIAPGGTLALSGSGGSGRFLELNRTVINNGTVTWTGIDIQANNGTFQNNGNFIVDYSGQGELWLTGITGTNTFNNAGTFTKSGTSGVRMRSNTVFNNTGTVNVQQGTLWLEGGGSGSGQFNVAPGATLRFVGSGFNYTGGVTLNGGTLQLTTYTLETGTVQGTGTIAATTFTNESEVAPGIAGGDEVGAITVNGAYQQTTDGNLSLDIESASEFDTLDVNGAASLGGSLTISIPNDGSVQAGDAFEVIAAANTMGTKFDDVFTLGDDDIFLAPVYTDVAVAVVAFDEGDMDRENGVSQDDVSAFAMALTDPTSYRGTYGVSAREAGDLDDDGDCDVDDIDDFAALLNMSVAELTGRIIDSANVPEPATLLLAAVGFIVGMPRGNRRRQEYRKTT